MNDKSNVGRRILMRCGTPRRLRPGSMANLGIGHVGLMVTDLERSVRFYRNILGLRGRASGQRAAYVPSGADLLVLMERVTESLTSISVSVSIHLSKLTSGELGSEAKTFEF